MLPPDLKPLRLPASIPLLPEVVCWPQPRAHGAHAQIGRRVPRLPGLALEKPGGSCARPEGGTAGRVEAAGDDLRIVLPTYSCASGSAEKYAWNLCRVVGSSRIGIRMPRRFSATAIVW